MKNKSSKDFWKGLLTIILVSFLYYHDRYDYVGNIYSNFAESYAKGLWQLKHKLTLYLVEVDYTITAAQMTVLSLIVLVGQMLENKDPTLSKKSLTI